MNTCRPSAGFSLIELLLVLSLMGILAALVLPQLNTGIGVQLESTAQVIAADLAMARSLAVTNNSHYRLTVDSQTNAYTLAHSGGNSQFDTLPPLPFSIAASEDGSHTISLDELPRMGGYRVRLVGARLNRQLDAETSEVEFGPLGETTASEPTTIWLVAGSGSEVRFRSIEINPITGLATIGPLTSLGPVMEVNEEVELTP